MGVLFEIVACASPCERRNGEELAAYRIQNQFLAMQPDARSIPMRAHRPAMRLRSSPGACRKNLSALPDFAANRMRTSPIVQPCSRRQDSNLEEPRNRAARRGRLMPATPLTIVIVDHSQTVRETLRRRLSALPGITVSGEFEEAASALDGVRALQPEVIIVDVGLKTTSGLTFLKRIKEEAPSTLVLVFSNHAEPVFRRRFLSNGAHAFFDKSFELDQLCETIRSLLSRN